MALPSGSRLGPYEVTALIGQGGMGEVYRATDTNLKRAVAIKVLPEAVAGDAERLARFQREAEVLASLNHPNIASIYGLERSGGTTALVMELVEGPTLADRIKQGPIPLDETLPIAKQIAEALEAAHEQGIIHRDLKPANIKLRPDGTVKVLDFGLAKAIEPAGNSPSVSQSPTITSPALMTSVGVLLGTAAYMSPEQAKGRVADKRSDIWAFGCVLFEMLTGKRVFAGEDVSDTLASILRTEPDWSSLPSDTPAPVRTLLVRCLQKDPHKRLPHIGLARIEIEEGGPSLIGSHGAANSGGAKRWERVLPWTVAVLLFALAAGLGARLYLGRTPVEIAVVRASVLPPDGVRWAVATPATRFALSPDGRRLAFMGTDSDGRTRIWVRAVDSLVAQPLAGTEGALLPTWSPDSRDLAFFAADTLRKISAAGGPSLALADVTGGAGLAWGRNDVILFGRQEAPIFRVSASGGIPSQLTSLDRDAADFAHWQPSFLPDGRHFLYHVVGSRADTYEGRAVYIGSLDRNEKPRLLMHGGSNAQYASGHVLFMRGTTLMAQRFDADRLELIGEAMPLVEHVQIGGRTGTTGAFSVSTSGVLIYQTGSAEIRSRLTWFDRAGTVIGALGEPADQIGVDLSPDATQVVVSIRDPSIPGRRDLWLYDVGRGLRSRFTFDPAVELFATWSSDGERLLFNSRRSGRFDLYGKAANGAGSEERLLSDDIDKFPLSVSADNRFLAFSSSAGSSPLSDGDMWILPLASGGKVVPLLQTRFREFRQRFSPDGRWLAYNSDESGQLEVYVTSFPALDGKWQVSAAGGEWPRWRRDGKEIFYVSLDNTLIATAVEGGGSTLKVGSAQPLFELPRRVTAFQGFLHAGYDVTADGRRFLVNALFEEPSGEPLTLLVNWPSLMSPELEQ
jgi:dipeptidyl aminopeptidase/acylaminoacyl peptidase